MTPPTPHPADFGPNRLQPLVEATRGGLVESIHFGALAVVDSAGTLVAAVGDPGLVTFPRSSAKPLQAIPFIEAGGHEAFNLTQAEIALICASHHGTDAHVEVLRQFHAKIGISEDNLACGFHIPYDPSTAEALVLNAEKPSQIRHNCSGKHTGMLALARLNDWPIDGYLDSGHPVQQAILVTFAEMCGIDPDQIVIGVDGCSAPTFAVPLRNFALGIARLSDLADLSPERQKACQTITRAMWAAPEMVSGPEGFDTHLLRACPERAMAKGGAEGYQALGVMRAALGADTQGLGVAIKISDGDITSRGRHVVAVEILNQLGLLSGEDLAALRRFGPTTPLLNQAGIHVGDLRPVFQLNV